VPRSILTSIIQPRIEETFEQVRALLEASGFDRRAGRRVVLVGGASQLQGVPELAAQVLDKQVRRGKPLRVLGLAESTGGPAFATAAGLLAYATSRHATAPEGAFAGRAKNKEESNGLFGRFGLWFRENF
jgi:cell division protein FtsA